MGTGGQAKKIFGRPIRRPTGRIKEIVIRGGENIAPIEIENVAYRHPLVKEVAVFGVPDDLMGE
jgi:long-chain acyl-CoA synthetase